MPITFITKQYLLAMHLQNGVLMDLFYPLFKKKVSLHNDGPMKSWDFLTFSQTSAGFYVSAIKDFIKKHCGKRRNCS